jgi:hypothetical protein
MWGPRKSRGFCAIGAVAIELAEGQNLAVERGHQNGVFPNLAAIIDPGKRGREICIELLTPSDSG